MYGISRRRRARGRSCPPVGWYRAEVRLPAATESILAGANRVSSRSTMAGRVRPTASSLRSSPLAPPTSTYINELAASKDGRPAREDSRGRGLRRVVRRGRSRRARRQPLCASSRSTPISISSPRYATRHRRYRPSIAFLASLFPCSRPYSGTSLEPIIRSFSPHSRTRNASRLARSVRLAASPARKTRRDVRQRRRRTAPPSDVGRAARGAGGGVPERG